MPLVDYRCALELNSEALLVYLATKMRTVVQAPAACLTLTDKDLTNSVRSQTESHAHAVSLGFDTVSACANLSNFRVAQTRVLLGSDVYLSPKFASAVCDLLRFVFTRTVSSIAAFLVMKPVYRTKITSCARPRASPSDQRLSILASVAIACSAFSLFLFVTHLALTALHVACRRKHATDAPALNAFATALL